MQKERLSFTISPHIARQLEALADETGDSRSAIVERALEYHLREKESLLESMTNPVMRAFQAAVTSDPKVMKLIARMLSENLTDEEAQRIVDKAPTYREAGRQRKAAKRTRKSDEGGLAGEPA